MADSRDQRPQGAGGPATCLAARASSGTEWSRREGSLGYGGSTAHLEEDGGGQLAAASPAMEWNGREPRGPRTGTSSSRGRRRRPVIRPRLVVAWHRVWRGPVAVGVWPSGHGSAARFAARGVEEDRFNFKQRVRVSSPPASRGSRGSRTGPTAKDDA
jgi:hypothetical protein